MSQLDNTAITRLLAAAADDYVNWNIQCNNHGTNSEQASHYLDNMSIRTGKKYIKVISDGSVWGFIVNCDDDKQFAKGDILKAASYKAPTRNKARGNIYETYSVQWTGPHYL